MTDTRDGGVKLSADALAILKMYRPETYAIGVSPVRVRKELLAAGFIEWVPGPAWGGHHQYAITDEGRAALSRTKENG